MMGWFRWLARPFMWTTATVESWFVSGRKLYKTQLQAFRYTIEDPYDIVRYYNDNGFHWRSDAKLFGFTLDHARKPWVTFKKKEGDCEDFMLLNEYLVEKITDYSERWAVSNKKGSWHAILVFPYKDGWGLLSNTRYSFHDTKEEALHHFYGLDHGSEMSM
jgi:uncharacterized membrane protein YoaT (DUF817 family)